MAAQVSLQLENEPAGPLSNERALSLWETMKGPALIGYSEKPYPRSIPGFEGILVVANALIDRVSDGREFVHNSGILDFCVNQRENILAMISDQSSYPVYTMLRNLNELCPNFADSPDIKAFILYHKLMHRFLHPGVSVVFLRVEREKIFDQSVAFLKRIESERLSLGIYSVKFEGEDAFGSGVRNDWFSSFAKDIIESGIFTMSQEGAHNTYLTKTFGHPVPLLVFCSHIG